MKLKKRHSERGSIFAVLLGGIAIVGVLGATLYQMMAGPVASVSRLTQNSLVKTQLLAISRIAVLDATTQTAAGDCDSDEFIEPRAARTGGTPPTGGGLIPVAMGAPTTDPWGTEYGYCVWDMGPLNAQAGCGGATGRLNGADDPFTGEVQSLTLLAVISAGEDRTFNTSCSNFTNATSATLSSSGDDIVQSLTYTEAASSTNSLWSLKSGDPNTAVIDKNLEVGDDITFTESTGLIDALAVTTSGIITANGGVQPGTESTITTCSSSQEGKFRYNDTSNRMQVCSDANGSFAWETLDFE